MNSGIYQIINLVDDKRYIGSTVNFKNRKRFHFSLLVRNIHHNQYIQNAYNKYGKENFEFQILLYCEKKDLLFYEQIAINIFDFKTELYNILPTAGNNLGFKTSDEVKEKIRQANTGRKHTKETKEKMSESRKGRKHTEQSKNRLSESHKGKTLSEEHKFKIGQASRNISEETRLKLSKAQKGRKRSKEFCEKMSFILTNLPPEKRKNISESKKNMPQEVKDKISLSHIGLKHNDETKQKLKNIPIEKRQEWAKKSRLYINFTDDQILKIIDMRKEGISLKEIGKYFNCHKSTIKRRLINNG